MKKMMFLFVVFLVLFSSGIFCAENVPDVSADAADSNFTWKGKGILVTPQDQGNWGTCAIFSSISIFESLVARETGELVNLSEQHFINNSNEWNNDSGVSPEKVFKFLEENGVVYDKTLPYTGIRKNIPLNPEYNYKLDKWGCTVLANNSPEKRRQIIKEHIVKYGPVITNMILFDDLDWYTSGVYSVGKNAKEVGGHWVVILGWHDDANMASGGYWTCKNSWGDKWGEEGYFDIAYNDVSGIDDFLLYYVESLQL